METYKISEARALLTQLVSAQSAVVIQNPQHASVLISKHEFDSLHKKLREYEAELINHEMDAILARNKVWYSTEEVEQMMAEAEHGQMG